MIKIKLQDFDGDTALHEAVSKKNQAMINILCDAASRIDLANCRNVRGFGAIHHAAFKVRAATLAPLWRESQFCSPPFRATAAPSRRC